MWLVESLFCPCSSQPNKRRPDSTCDTGCNSSSDGNGSSGSDGDSYSYGLDGDPEHAIRRPEKRDMDCLPQSYDPMIELAAAYDIIIQMDGRWSSLEFAPILDESMRAEQLSHLQDQLASTQRLPLDTVKGLLNRYPIFVRSEPDLTKRLALIRQFEAAKANYSFMRNEDMAKTMQLLKQARDPRLHFSLRLLAYQKAIFYTDAQSYRKDIVSEYSDYCRSIPKQ